MGSIGRFNLKKIKDDFQVHTFVETGTWYGDGLNWALSAGFQVFSCEINHRIFEIARDRFENRYGCQIFNAKSYDFLKHTPDVPCLYFLDAHFPELYYNRSELEDPNRSEEPTSITPLSYEINQILRKSNGKRSVIIIDDWRIYESGNYENGQIDPSLRGPDMFDYILEMFSETHDIILCLSDEGYLILIPKSFAVTKEELSKKYWTNFK